MKQRRYIDRVKNPQGRMDWLAAKLLERVVSRTTNPLLQAIYSEFQSDIEKALRANLGPRNRNMRQLRTYLNNGMRVLEAANQR